MLERDEERQGLRESQTAWASQGVLSLKIFVVAGNRKKPLQVYFLFACARERLYSENEVEKAVGNLCCVILFSWAMTDQTQPQRIYTSAFYPDTVFIRLVGAKPEKTCWKPNATL